MKGTNYSQAFYELIFTTHFGLLGDLVIALAKEEEATARQLSTLDNLLPKASEASFTFCILAFFDKHLD